MIVNVREKMKIFYLFGVLCLLSGWGWAQGCSFNDGYDDYGPYYYRSPKEWKRIREKVFGWWDAADSLRVRTVGQKFTNVICPWWVEDLYRPEVIRGQLQRIGYVGYVLNPLTGLPLLTNSWNEPELLDSAWQDVPLDLVVYCRGADAFDYFLLCDSARLNFLRTVFDPEKGLINRRHAGRRPAGLHFYLPDYSFREKRAFMQFVRSVSMVIDNYCRDGIKPYEEENCWLTFTFSPAVREELSFLSGVMELSDEVHLAAYDEYGLPVASPEVYTYRNDPTPVLRRMFNQFYLFSFFSDVLPDSECCDDFSRLAGAAYSEHNWRGYLLLDVLLLAVLLVLILLYHLSSPFFIWVDRHRSYVVPVVITFVTEIVIVFLFMVEALSPNEMFLNLDDNTHWYLLMLPLLFISLHVGLKILGGKNEMP